MTTHLLCGSDDSDKLRAARSWGGRVWVLRAEWLLACLREWRRVDENAYRLDEEKAASGLQDDVSTADDDSAMGDEEQIIVDNLFLSEPSPRVSCVGGEVGGEENGEVGGEENGEVGGEENGEVGGEVDGDGNGEGNDNGNGEGNDNGNDKANDVINEVSHTPSKQQCKSPSKDIPANIPLQDDCVPASQDSDDSSPSQSLSTPSKRSIHALSQSPFPTPSKRPMPHSLSPSPNKSSRPLFSGAGKRTGVVPEDGKGIPNNTTKAPEDIKKASPVETKPSVFLLSSELPADTAIDTIRQLGGRCIQTHE